MLRRLANLVLRWGLAGILGVTSLLGTELHEICGIHHALYGDECGCEPATGTVQHGPSLAVRQPQCSHDEANCPVCNYLAQGRLLGERVEGPSVALSVPNRIPAILLVAPSPHLQPFQARAPPAA